MKERVLHLVERLRSAGLRISVGEVVDAMEAVAVAGIEREILRESLAATLAKDQALRARFDEVFDECFPTIAAGRDDAGRAGGGGGREEARAQGRSEAGGGAGRPPEPPDSPDRDASAESRGEPQAADGERGGHDERADARGTDRRVDRDALREAADAAGERSEHAGFARAAQRLGRERELMKRRLRDLDSRELSEVRELAQRLAHRFERRWSRRERRARHGRVDLRATMRLALARGGVPVETLRRRRRPSRPDLLALVDVSWSTATAASLLLSLLAPAHRFFRRVTLLAYVGDVVPVSFEGGHVVPHEPLDLDARSDFGRVLVKVAARDISRREIVLILGDARNNRLPGRKDALHDIALRARAVIWLNPDPRERWGQGDSDIAAYAPHVDLLLGAEDLGSLARGLDRFARRVGGLRRVRRPAHASAPLGMMGPVARGAGRMT